MPIRDRVDPSKIPLPSRSIIATGDPLESRYLSDTDRDRIAVVFCVGFLCVVCALALALHAASLGFFDLH